MNESIQNRILAEIAAERTLQDIKFDEQNHGDLRWLSILVEEVGEASKSIADFYNIPVGGRPLLVAELRTELVQVAAVAVAWIECLDRRGPQE